jgi:hypothetical protein
MSTNNTQLNTIKGEQPEQVKKPNLFVLNSGISL